jgi:ADP-ribosyl-[dinitrogen reductase] hydrolase
LPLPYSRPMSASPPLPPLSTLPIGSGALGLMRGPGTGSADLATDLALIADWAPALVISLTETTEMEALGIADLGTLVQARGFAHAHLPIPDFGVPPPNTVALWRGLSPKVHGALAAGARVLVHCRGGLGRSGTLAALVLMERGLSADIAIQQVRHARPGAIETAEQERWLMAQVPPQNRPA